MRPGPTCLGETTPHLCELVEQGQPGRAEQLVALAEGSPGPTLLEKAGSLARSVVAHAADGFRVATDAAQSGRLEICRACPRYLPDSGTCALCGCYLRVKIRMASESCPDDPPRWGPA